jgi:hypothetical protein
MSIVILVLVCVVLGMLIGNSSFRIKVKNLLKKLLRIK